MAPANEHDSVIIELLPHVRNWCRKHLPKWARADAEQDCMVHLLKVAATAKPKSATLRTYLGVAARRFVLYRRRQLRRGRASQPVELNEELHLAPDTRHDRHVEALAHAILSDPDQHVSAAKARLIRAVVASPGASGAELAEQLGLSVSTLWPALSRVRGEIVEILNTRCA